MTVKTVISAAKDFGAEMTVFTVILLAIPVA